MRTSVSSALCSSTRSLRSDQRRAPTLRRVGRTITSKDDAFARTSTQDARGYSPGVVAGASFDALERQQLCDLFIELGPDAPTLLAPWTTRDLAAHLVLREHDLRAAPGLVMPGAWHRLAEARTAELAKREFTSLVEQVRSGPPPGFFRIGWVRRFPNLN